MEILLQPLHHAVELLGLDGMVSEGDAQDLLGLGRVARMNVPGRARGNWRWRAKASDLGSRSANVIRTVVNASGRLN